MSFVTPSSEEQVEFLAPVFQRIRAAMGFVPNSMLTMAHMPQLPAAFSMLAGVVFGADLKDLVPDAAADDAAADLPPYDGPSGNLPPDLVQLVAGRR